jgi:hypothetical protein
MAQQCDHPGPQSTPGRDDRQISERLIPETEKKFKSDRPFKHMVCTTASALHLQEVERPIRTWVVSFSPHCATLVYLRSGDGRAERLRQNSGR